jgi:uncharacterized peroxidase-related enzyme
MQTHAFPPHTLESAPPAARAALQKLQASVGMIPNIAAAMAESPVLISAFVALRATLEQDGSFNAVEREVVSLVNAVENGCAYCTAIHSTFGLRAGLDASAIERLRSRRAPDDHRLAALAAFARQLVLTRGHVTEGDLEAFLAAGFQRAQALELIARLALSVMANYTGHLVHPEPDAGIRAQYRSA